MAAVFFIEKAHHSPQNRGSPFAFQVA